MQNCEQEHSCFDIGAFENELEDDDDDDDDEFAFHRMRRRGTLQPLVRGR